MILSLNMPQLGVPMSQGVVERIHISEGCRIEVGAKLLDIRVDLSAVAAQDCPPISYFRMVSREAGWVRRLICATGAVHSMGEILALVSTDRDESCDEPPQRPLRIASAGILADRQW